VLFGFRNFSFRALMPLVKFRDLGIDIVLVGRGNFGSEAEERLKIESFPGVHFTYQKASVGYLGSS
jgi:hypothetical protein